VALVDILVMEAMPVFNQVEQVRLERRVVVPVVVAGPAVMVDMVVPVVVLEFLVEGPLVLVAPVPAEDLRSAVEVVLVVMPESLE
jgi:hypothetical protein